MATKTELSKEIKKKNLPVWACLAGLNCYENKDLLILFSFKYLIFIVCKNKLLISRKINITMTTTYH